MSIRRLLARPIATPLVVLVCFVCFVCSIPSSPALAAMGETASQVATREALEACVAEAHHPGELDRTCVVTRDIEGPIAVRLDERPPLVTTVACAAGARIVWASHPSQSYPSDAFQIRVPPEVPTGWVFALRDCDVSDLGPPGRQTVQGPILVNEGNVFGTFVWDGVTFVTEAYGPSTVGGGVNPRSNTALEVRNSFVFAPICWDAKTVSDQPGGIVHRFFRSECVVNARSEVGSPRGLKVEGATHVFSDEMIWRNAQISQSQHNQHLGPIDHDFSHNIFLFDAMRSYPGDAVFFSGRDADFHVSGLVVSTTATSPREIVGFWNGAWGEERGEMVVLDVPEPGPAAGGLAGITLLVALARRRARVSHSH